MGVRRGINTPWDIGEEKLFITIRHCKLMYVNDITYYVKRITSVT